MIVQTIKGLQDSDSLRVEDVVEWGENYRKVITRWWDGTELVKEDVAVSILRGLDMQSVQGKING